MGERSAACKDHASPSAGNLRFGRTDHAGTGLPHAHLPAVRRDHPAQLDEGAQGERPSGGSRHAGRRGGRGHRHRRRRAAVAFSGVHRERHAGVGHRPRASPSTSRAACCWLQDICAKRTNKPWPTCARSRHMPLRRRTAFLCPNVPRTWKNCSTTFMARFRKRTTRCSRCPGSRRKCWGPTVQPSRCWRRRRTMPRQAADGRRRGRPLTICRVPPSTGTYGSVKKPAFLHSSNYFASA